MIKKNDTWKLVERPLERKVIDVKWVYRTKLNADGLVNKHKSRLVVKIYAQIFCVDLSETFALVTRLDTIKLIFAIATQKSWQIYQLDVKSSFLNGFLQEEIYFKHPGGFVLEGHEDKIYLLKKALYGLKQSPKIWYTRINDHLSDLGLKKILSESTLYIKHFNSDSITIFLYMLIIF